MANVKTPDEIDALLPQTQCGLCGYGGCMPYAKAIAFEKAPINLCPPGGVDTLHALAMLTDQDALRYLPDMEKKAKPAQLAKIREAECIGCTKCIEVCPVDAIIGSAKQMHTIITAECTGCELCIPPCPVDCIDLVLALNTSPVDITVIDKRRERYHTHEMRLQKQKRAKEIIDDDHHSLNKKRDYIAEAIARAKAKK